MGLCFHISYWKPFQQINFHHNCIWFCKGNRMKSITCTQLGMLLALIYRIAYLKSNLIGLLQIKLLRFGCYLIFHKSGTLFHHFDLPIHNISFQCLLKLIVRSADRLNKYLSDPLPNHQFSPNKISQFSLLTHQWNWKPPFHDFIQCQILKFNLVGL